MGVILGITMMIVGSGFMLYFWGGIFGKTIGQDFEWYDLIVQFVEETNTASGTNYSLPEEWGTKG